MHNAKTLAAKQAHEFAVLSRLVPEAMTAEMRAIIRAIHHREVIAASAAARFPALASTVCSLVSDDRGDVALDLISEALATLQTDDPILFAPIPTREDMLKLASSVYDGVVSDNVRASLWASHCDIPEARRFGDAYLFRHRLAERGANNSSGPARSRASGGLIDGGSVALATVQAAHDNDEAAPVKAPHVEGVEDFHEVAHEETAS